MSAREPHRGHAVVVQPGEGPSYWQPVPANGHADPALYPDKTRFSGLSMGYQTIAPGGRVREHSHGDQVELQICFRGKGRVVVQGEAAMLSAQISGSEKRRMGMNVPGNDNKQYVLNVMHWLSGLLKEK